MKEILIGAISGVFSGIGMGRRNYINFFIK